MGEVIALVGLASFIIGLILGRLLIKEDIRFLREFYDKHRESSECEKDLPF